MKISLEWLSDFLPGPLDPQVLADTLTHGGLPVEVIEQHGNDTVIDVEVTSNRSDCLSHLGVARELAALLDRPLKEPPAPPLTAGQSAAPPRFSLTVDAPHLCPTYTARIIRNVRVAPSPDWLARRLQSFGLRPINNVVDITNYVLFELGQPLHAFDLDKLAGPAIVVRTARPGEKLTTLDGTQLALNPSMLVIADATRPAALAGVMGGLDTEVTPTTTNILLESARFDPLSIRQTARALSMKSDSSYRFERGLDPTLAQRASDRAAQLLAELAGGEPGPLMTAAPEQMSAPKTLALRLPRLRQVLGINISPDAAVAALRRLRLAPALAGDVITTRIPPDRLDLNIEIDLVEEVARIVGYDKIPTRDEIAIRLTPPDPVAKATALICDTLVAAGYFEAITFSFVSDSLAADFLPATAHALPRADAAVRKADARLRPSLLPGLLEAFRRNETVGTPNAHLFETGSAFWTDAAGQIEESRRLALVGSSDLHQLRGTVELLLQKLNAHRDLKITPADHRGFAPGAAATIEWAGQPIGHLGLIDPKIAGKLSLRHAPAAAELDLSPLVAGHQAVPQLLALPRFPAIRRDLSFILPESTRYEQLEALVRQANPAHLEEIEYVTTYRGKPLEKGTKSVTITLVFRSPTETLMAGQVDSAVEAVMAAAASLNATVRT